ncbi:MAG: ABC transporter transmembrane domain-containing protein [Rhodobacteraceae bacterium]|nr:ABC transporter transmembrane domain-containing protein [Paracoccaceae bacterium]MCY4140483.1 ABC transporter transmembrane domain-containing protein [Paracoccaceae bacterium]
MRRQANSRSWNRVETGDEAPGAVALTQLFPFLRPYRWTMLLAFVTLITTAAISLSLPVAVRRVVDGLLIESPRLMDLYFVAAIVIAGLLALGSGIRFYLVSRLGERVVADIRSAVYDRMICMSPAYFETRLTGEVLSRITTDTTLIQTVVGSSMSIALRNLLILSGGVTMMFVTSTRLAFLAILVVPLVVVPILLLGRRVRHHSMLAQDRIAECSSHASETLLAVQTVQAFNLEPSSSARFGGHTESAYRAAMRRVTARTQLTVIVIFLAFAGVVGVLWAGAYGVRSDVMTGGELVQFVILAVMVAGAVAALSEVWGEILRSAGATDRLLELLHAEDSVSDPECPVQFPSVVSGEITFSEVSFRYPSRPNHAALNELSFSIEPGETVAFVGPSGAGKSTIFRLLLRYFDPVAGKIEIGGIDIRQSSRRDVRKCLSYVPQEPAVFATSAMENIRFGRIDATDEEVIAAAKASAAHEFLQELPNGYFSDLGERGVKLSGGQRQRIAIARAILRDAPVLLLDEATSALDAESERSIQVAVDRLSADRTTLIIAHRLATIKKADRIIVLDRGRVEAEGNHDELSDSDGLYARLASLQFAREENSVTASSRSES